MVCTISSLSLDKFWGKFLVKWVDWRIVHFLLFLTKIIYRNVPGPTEGKNRPWWFRWTGLDSTRNLVNTLQVNFCSFGLNRVKVLQGKSSYQSYSTKKTKRYFNPRSHQYSKEIISLTLGTILKLVGQLFALIFWIKWKFWKNKSTISASLQNCTLHIQSLQLIIHLIIISLGKFKELFLC